MIFILFNYDCLITQIRTRTFTYTKLDSFSYLYLVSDRDKVKAVLEKVMLNSGGEDPEVE